MRVRYAEVSHLFLQVRERYRDACVVIKPPISSKCYLVIRKSHEYSQYKYQQWERERGFESISFEACAMRYVLCACCRVIIKTSKRSVYTDKAQQFTAEKRLEHES